MNNRDKVEIEKSLTELDDAEAIEIMEGRLPARDGQPIQEAAAEIAHDVLRSPDLEVVGGSGGRITTLISQQPWMRLAAAAVVGALVVTLADPGFRSGNSGSTPTGIATANVIYLDVFRSAGGVELPSIVIDERDQWVTLVGYPDFTDADTLSVYVETLQNDSWTVVQQQTLNAGTRDSVVVTIASESLVPGRYRLRMESESSAGTSAIASEFVVVE